MFRIDKDTYNITWQDGSLKLEDGDFDSEQSLRTIADALAWGKATVTTIWNSFAGVAPFSDLKPQKQFRNRPYGLTAIWKAIQRLRPEGEPAALAETPLEIKEVRTPKKKSCREKPAKKSDKENGFRAGTKAAEALRLMARKGGATAAELQERFGWLPHTLRGFVSTLGSKHGINVLSEAHESKGRIYRIEA